MPPRVVNATSRHNTGALAVPIGFAISVPGSLMIPMKHPPVTTAASSENQEVLYSQVAAVYPTTDAWRQEKVGSGSAKR